MGIIGESNASCPPFDILNFSANISGKRKNSHLLLEGQPSFSISFLAPSLPSLPICTTSLSSAYSLLVIRRLSILSNFFSQPHELVFRQLASAIPILLLANPQFSFTAKSKASCCFSNSTSSPRLRVFCKTQ